MADLGFPVDMCATPIERLSRGGSRISLEGGANPPVGTYDFAKFSKKLHEIDSDSVMDGHGKTFRQHQNTETDTG